MHFSAESRYGIKILPIAALWPFAASNQNWDKGWKLFSMPNFFDPPFYRWGNWGPKQETFLSQSHRMREGQSWDWYQLLPTLYPTHPSPAYSHAGKSFINHQPQSRRAGPMCSRSLPMNYAPNYQLPFFPILWVKVWSHIRFSLCFRGYKAILISNSLVNGKWVNLILIKTRKIIRVNLIKSNLELIK